MPTRRHWLLLCLAALIAVAGCTADPTPATSPTTTGTPTAPSTTTAETATPTTRTVADSRPTVTLRDRNGTTLGSVTVTVAATRSERIIGLSNTESLAAEEGMLFVYDSAGRYAYVMRDMAFPLDIVFVAPNGTITRIHHAETEPGQYGDDLTEYEGEGKYVLEVNRGYANRTGLDVGDRVVIPDGIE